MNNSPKTLLRIDGSARRTGSTTRMLTNDLINALKPNQITVRDLADGIDLVDETWVGANFTPVENRSDVQRAKLALSDSLIAELKAADTLVIGLPVYNFGVPASIKAWIDMVARAGVTFRYSETGPEGLLRGIKAYIILASGGTKAGSEIDFASNYMRYVLGFLGITNVTIIAADQQGAAGQEALKSARDQISSLDLKAA